MPSRGGDACLAIKKVVRVLLHESLVRVDLFEMGLCYGFDGTE